MLDPVIGTETAADLDNKSSNMNDTLNSHSLHADRLDFLKRKLKEAKELQSNKKSSSLNERAIDASFRDENLHRFSGKDVSQLVCIEIFAGSARLSRAFKDVGFKTLAVDKITARSEQMHIATFDLCDDDQVRALEQLMTKDADNIVYAHFAPACGTASRAREKPQPHLERQGFKVAKPLRSDQEPEGKSGLSGLDIQNRNCEHCLCQYSEIDQTCSQLRHCLFVGKSRQQHFFVSALHTVVDTRHWWL